MTHKNHNPEHVQSSPDHPLHGYFIPAQSTEIDNYLSIKDLWLILMKYKLIFALIVILSIIISMISAFTMTSVYRADVLLLPSSNQSGGGQFNNLMSQFGGLADLAGISRGNNNDVETPIAILKSRKFITQFINDLNLKPILYENIWDEQKSKWKIVEPSIVSKIKQKILPKQKKMFSGNLPGEPTNEQAFKKFQGDILDITQDNKTKLVTLSIEWRDSHQAAQWANVLVERLNEDIRKRTINEAERSIKYLEQQVNQTSISELHNVLYRIIEEQTKNIMLAKISDEYALQVIDPAVPPDTFYKPKRKLIVMIGIIFGVVFGIFIVFMLNYIEKLKVERTLSI